MNNNILEHIVCYLVWARLGRFLFHGQGGPYHILFTPGLVIYHQYDIVVCERIMPEMLNNSFHRFHS